MRPNTKNQGANDERTAHIAKVRRMIRTGKGTLHTLLAWLLARAKRYNQKPRGLGRK